MFKIDTLASFESGSAKVLALDKENQVIRIVPAGNPRNGMPNWWYLRVDVPWVLEHSNPTTIAFCIKTPWNITAGTPEGYKLVGQKLGNAVEKLLKEEQFIP